ncbi:MAG: hypothetical protein LBI27_02620 [Clostridiales bacterium]|jgi:hypothetical protein|nr:hypothetical protein [Clostridiales bacterium]
MAVVVSLAVIGIVLAVLTISAGSRNVTARYKNFSGLYDLAVTGNEQVFYLLESAFLLHREDAHDIEEIIIELNLILENNFTYAWGLSVDFAGELTDTYSAVTYVRKKADNTSRCVHGRTDIEYYIETQINKSVSGVSSISAIVCSAVVLDFDAIKMVELHRIAD